MHIILLSGGSGQRLWPLSNDSRSKQFLKLLRNENTNELESMYQRTCRKLQELGLEKNLIITANIGQKDLLESQQIFEVPCIFEMERRDTFPAIALANSYLVDVQHVLGDEVVVVCPIDTYANDEFYMAIKKLATIFEKSNANIGLLGVKPTYPSAKYGYMIPASIHRDYSQVDYFVEKPSEEVAGSLIQKGALWNCGVFAFRAKYMHDIMKQLSHQAVTYNWLQQNYHSIPKISFDYAVVEKEQNIIAVEYEGPWKDLGTWNTLTEEVDTKVIGKGLLSHDSTNTHIINELGIPVNGMGLHNMVVVASPEGILVSDKNESHRLKEFNNTKNGRPMFEERRWGYYQVLDFVSMDNGQKALTKRLTILKDKNISYQKHLKRSEVWTILSGKAEFVLNDVKRIVGPGDILVINKEDKHGIKALEETEIIEVQLGTELIEEDIIRLEMDWSNLVAQL